MEVKFLIIPDWMRLRLRRICRETVAIIKTIPPVRTPTNAVRKVILAATAARYNSKRELLLQV